MNCKYCKHEIPEESVFCLYCGERVTRKKREKKKEITVPEPRQLPSGAWNIQLRKEGESITEATRELCREKARAIRAGFLKQEKAPQKQSLDSFLRGYIDAVTPILSPSTISGYESIYRNRFRDFMSQDIHDINWQDLINDDAKDAAAKTVHNDWGLVTAAFDFAKQPAPKVKLPRIVKKERDFFDYEQILQFLKAVRGRKCELICILALHSLRMSEILALEQSSLSDNAIHVRGAMVRNKNNEYVFKEANKTSKSRRDVPVMISRLTELWPEEGQPLSFQKHSAANSMLQDVCEKAGLPILTMHELRHSFASLAFHLKWDIMTTCDVGGWSDPSTVQNIYTHLSKKDKNANIKRMQAFYKKGR